MTADKVRCHQSAAIASARAMEKGKNFLYLTRNDWIKLMRTKATSECEHVRERSTNITDLFHVWRVVIYRKRNCEAERHICKIHNSDTISNGR